MIRSNGIVSHVQKILAWIARVEDKVTGNDLRKVYKSVFSGAGGEIVLRDLCRRYYISSSAFALDPLLHAERAGERNTVLYILSMVYEKLEKEDEPEKK
jgi:hypothetical protein